MSLFNLFRLWPFYFNAFLYRISYNRRKSGEDNEKFITIIVAIILLILFGTLATLYINNLSDNLYSETDEYLNDLTNQTAKAIKNRINENLTQLTTISLIIQQDGILQEPLLDYLNQLAQRDGVKRFGIADLQGNVVTSDHQTFRSRLF